MASIRSRQTPNGVRYDVRFRVNGIQRTKTFRSTRTRSPSAGRWRVMSSLVSSMIPRTANGSSVTTQKPGCASDWSRDGR